MSRLHIQAYEPDMLCTFRELRLSVLNFMQMACSDACQAVIEHGARRRAYRGVLEIHWVQPEGDAAHGGVSGGVSGLLTSMQPLSTAAAAATRHPGSNKSSPEKRIAAKLGTIMRGGSKAKAPPQPLRHGPQQRQKKGKRKR